MWKMEFKGSEHKSSCSDVRITVGEPREMHLFSAVYFKVWVTVFIHNPPSPVANFHLFCNDFIHKISTPS